MHRRYYPWPAVARRDPGPDGSPPPSPPITATPTTMCAPHPTSIPSLWPAGMKNWHTPGASQRAEPCVWRVARTCTGGVPPPPNVHACAGEPRCCQVWAAILLLLRMLLFLQGEKCWWQHAPGWGNSAGGSHQSLPAVQISNQPMACTGGLCYVGAALPCSSLLPLPLLASQVMLA